MDNDDETRKWILSIISFLFGAMIFLAVVDYFAHEYMISNDPVEQLRESEDN